MIRFFWKYRRLNFIVIFVFLFFCIYSFDSFKVYFDSERIIELVDIEEDIIEKSIDDRNLLLIGIELKDSLSFPLILQLDAYKNVTRVPLKANQIYKNSKDPFFNSDTKVSRVKYNQCRRINMLDLLEVF